ncbi:Epoxide hydrolase [Gracilaria domingensis]|nr:Epoxide hydrolase [Gracilaria domingensis]
MTLGTAEKTSSKKKNSLTEVDGSFADIDGLQVYYTRTEPPNSSHALPLHLCIHGFGASSFSFSPLIQSLHSPYDPPVIAYDAPAFGFTSRPGKLHFYTPGFSARIASSLAMAFSPDRKYVVMAHSMGALAACRLLLKEPSRVAAVVLIAPAILPGSHLPSWLQRGLRILSFVLVNCAVALASLFAPILAVILRVGLRPEGFWRSALRLARHPSRKLPDEIVEGYRLPLKAPSWERGIINFSRATLKERAKALDTAEDFVEMIGQLTYPPRILIVHGESDAVVPLANSRKLADGFGAKLKVMERCGHVPHEEAPIEFCDIVYDFLHDADVL